MYSKLFHLFGLVGYFRRTALAVASVILGGISLSGREVSLTLMGGAWLLMAFLLYPALKIG